MLAAVDVHYRSDRAKAVYIQFNDWWDESPSAIEIAEIDEVADYIPGEFYKRELPCILKVLEKVEKGRIEAIIIDGYVYLDDNHKSGLGWYLYEALDRQIPVIGVAKKSFHNNRDLVRKVFRGSSRNPLYITSIGLGPDEAAAKIKKMKGERIPVLLKILDRKTKE